MNPTELSEQFEFGRWRSPIVYAAVGAVAFALGLGALGRLRSYGTPSDAVQQLAANLRAGDVVVLRKDPKLGFEDRAEAEVEERGTAAFDEKLAIYGKRRQLGRQELQTRRDKMSAIRENVRLSGVSAFDALGIEEKWQVWVGEGSEAWLYTQALENLKPEDRALFPTDAKFLSDDTLMAALQQKICQSALDTDDKVLLAAIMEKPDLAKDPFYADVLNHCHRAGAKKLRRPLRHLRDARAKAVRMHWPRPQASGVDRREAAKKEALAESSLSAQDKAYLQANAAVDDPDAEERLILQFGTSQLDEEERQQIQQQSEDDFVAGREGFVERVGVERFRKFLKETFGKCKVTVKRVERRGTERRSLLRSSRALVHVRWSSKPCTQYAGKEHLVTFKKGRWAFGFASDDDDDDEEVEE